MKLIITNGMSAVHSIKNAGIEAEIIPWDDALHDGPVPGGKTLEELSEIRAKYISDIGWGTYEEIHQRFVERDNKLKQHGDYDELTLWFEHDLYDQLQLMQILAWLYENRDPSTKLTVICERKYVAEQDKITINQQWKNRTSIDPNVLKNSDIVWGVFSSKNPLLYHDYLMFKLGQNQFYYMNAINRFKEEYPKYSTDESSSGLTTTEQNALSNIYQKPMKIGKVFHLVSEKEEAKFLGDTSFAFYMTRLSDVEYPLIIFDNGETIQYHPQNSTMENFWNRTFILTETGKNVLKGKQDHIRLNGIDRWMGGVHITPDNFYYLEEDSDEIKRALY